LNTSVSIIWVKGKFLRDINGFKWEKNSSLYIMFHKFTYLKMKPPFAEITAKKKIDEAKPGAFNKIISTPLC